MPFHRRIETLGWRASFNQSDVQKNLKNYMDKKIEGCAIVGKRIARGPFTMR